MNDGVEAIVVVAPVVVLLGAVCDVPVVAAGVGGTGVNGGDSVGDGVWEGGGAGEGGAGVGGIGVNSGRSVGDGIWEGGGTGEGGKNVICASMSQQKLGSSDTEPPTP